MRRRLTRWLALLSDRRRRDRPLAELLPRPLDRRVLVVRKYEAGYRFTNDEASIPYNLVTDSWRSDFPELEFRSYYEGEYLGVVPGKSRLLVKTRRGRFGLEWVESFSFDRAPR